MIILKKILEEMGKENLIDTPGILELAKRQPKVCGKMCVLRGMVYLGSHKR